MNLPKVLIIGQPFNNVTGGGITLTNLFKGWDKEKIAVTCLPHLIDNSLNTNICNTYYQLGYKEHKMVFPFNLLKHNYSSGLLKFNEKKNNGLKSFRSRFREKIIMDYLYPTLKFIGLYHYISKVKLSTEFCRWLNNYNPDVIYAQASSRDAVLFCISVLDFMKKPFIFHMMDDWPTLAYSKGVFKKYWQKTIDFEIRLLVEKADLLMSISDQMGLEYYKRYGKKFITFHNPIDVDFWKKYQKTNYELNTNPTILYAGRIGLGIDRSLEFVAKAISIINKELKLSLKFILQTKEKPTWIDKYENVIHNYFISYSDLPKTFSNADFLLLPYDFTEKSIFFVKLSMPTKMPEYMVSGTPIIVYAPEAMAIVKYSQKNYCAKVVTKNNVEEFLVAIKELIYNKSLRERIGQNAIKIAETEHNSLFISQKFKNLISSLNVPQTISK